MNGRDEQNKKIDNKVKSKISQLSVEQGRDYLMSFYNYMGANSLSNTKNVYMNRVVKFLNDIRKPVDLITFDDMLQYMEDIKEKSNGDNTTVSYQVVTYSALKKFFSYMYASKKIDINPMDGVEKPKMRKSELDARKSKHVYLSTKDINRMFKKIDSGVGSRRARCYQEKWRSRDKAILALFVNTGLRCSGLTSINVDDIYLEENKIRVIDKGDSPKWYDLADDVMEILEEWMYEREIIMGNSINNTAALFISNQKQRMAQLTVSKLIKKYSEAIGMTISPHKLRGTVANLVYEATGDIYYTQDLLNHSSPQTTEIYLPAPKKQKNASVLISAKLNY